MDRQSTDEGAGTDDELTTGVLRKRLDEGKKKKHTEGARLSDNGVYFEDENDSAEE